MTDTRKILVRGIPEMIFDRITNAAKRAERSNEAEVRFALRELYDPSRSSPVPQQSLREKWQSEAAARLVWLCDRLNSDGVNTSRYPLNPIEFAERIGENNPGPLLDCFDGRQGPSFDLANRLAVTFNCDATWIMSGVGTPFPVRSLSSDYHDFFLPELDELGRPQPDSTFYFLRISGGSYDGTLLILRKLEDHWEGRYECTRFCLKDSMGSGGRGNLKRFLIFIKSHFGQIPIISYIYNAKEYGDPELGHHHPKYYLQPTACNRDNWLNQLFNGEQPGDWLTEFDYELKEVRSTSFNRI